MKYPAKARTSSMESVPAPVGGINSVDPLANMDQQDAIDLLNFIPGTNSVVARQGYSRWVTGLPNKVETLAPYLAMNGEVRLFGMTDIGIYDVSSKASTPSVSSPLTRGYCSTVMFSTVAAQALVVCNGLDATRHYDGTSWTLWSQNATPSAPGQVKGVDPAKFIKVHSHKRRLWFVEKESMTAWYLPIDSLGGEAKPLYLGSVFRRGGSLTNIMTWSLDSGSGLDDIIIFQSSEGELAGYEGSNPDVTTDWALSAVHYVAPSFTSRASADVGGELVLLTSAGLYQTSKIVSGIGAVSLSSQDTLSYKVSKRLAELVQARGTAIGWELVLFSSANYLLIVVPETATQPAAQFVMNLLTGKWGRMDLPIRTACVTQDKLYFSDFSGNVYLYGGVYADDVAFDGSSSKPIYASFQQAYNYFNAKGQNKHFNLIRPIWLSQYPPSYFLTLSLDFYPVSISSLPAPPTESPNTPYWNTAIWGQSSWAPPFSTQFKWDGLYGLGYCASLVVSMRINKSTELVSTDWAFDIGSSL